MQRNLAIEHGVYIANMNVNFGHLKKINGSVRDVGKNLTYLPEAGLKEPGFIVPIQVNLAEIYEILHWFELGLTDNDIAQRLELDYRRLHRLLLKVRKAIAAYENRTIQVLKNVVEVDESYFGAQFKNRRRKQREKLRKEGKFHLYRYDEKRWNFGGIIGGSLYQYW